LNDSLFAELEETKTGGFATLESTQKNWLREGLQRTWGEEVSFGGGKGGKIAFSGLASTIYHARLMTKDSDPNSYLASNIAFLVTKGTLKANTTYTATFSGRVNNVEVSRSWKFTTRA
jgi:hypothetical protein